MALAFSFFGLLFGLLFGFLFWFSFWFSFFEAQGIGMEKEQRSICLGNARVILIFWGVREHFTKRLITLKLKERNTGKKEPAESERIETAMNYHSICISKRHFSFYSL